MAGKILAGYLVPGLPHMAFADKLGGWHELAKAYGQAGANARNQKPDVYVIYSSQWISVLGHSFQAKPKCEGLHVDENWYELGDLSYSLDVKPELAEKMADKAKAKQLATKLVAFDGFPLDTGTIVSQRFFNPDGKIPLAVLSCNVYANYADSQKLGEAAAEAIRDSGLNAVAIACTGMSGRYFTHDIKPSEDRFTEAADDKWNRRILDLAGSGQHQEVINRSSEFAAQTMADMGFKAHAWLMGVLGMPQKKANVLGYGPIWGTGAAVVEYPAA